MNGRLSKLRRPGDSTPAGPAAAGPTPSSEQPTAQASTLFADTAPPVPADVDPAAENEPSFRDRGRYRRRLRYLRRVRELGFRDLGGLVFDLHRFGRSGDQLIASKLAALGAVDRELRALERVMRDEQAFTDLREPGIAACARCGALHGSDARFCPSCGIQLSGPRALSELAVVASPPPGVAAPAAPAADVPVAVPVPVAQPEPAAPTPEPTPPADEVPVVPPADEVPVVPPADEVPVVPPPGPEPVTDVIRPAEAPASDALPVPPPPPVPPLPPGAPGRG